MMVERIGKKICRYCGLFYRRQDTRTACKVDNKACGPSKHCRYPDHFISIDEGKRRKKQAHQRKRARQLAHRGEAKRLFEELNPPPTRAERTETVKPVKVEPSVKPVKVEPSVKPVKVEAPKPTERKQCKGITASGKRCKKKAIYGDFCNIHSSENQTPHGVM